MFGLVSKNKLILNLNLIVYGLESDRDILKNEYDHKAISEWSYYKHLWNLRGKLELLDEFVNKLGE